MDRRQPDLVGEPRFRVSGLEQWPCAHAGASDVCNGSVSTCREPDFSGCELTLKMSVLESATAS